MTKIAIVGSGLIGRAWATVFASHGFTVALHDVKPEAAKAARTHIGKNLRSSPATASSMIRRARSPASASPGISPMR